MSTSLATIAMPFFRTVKAGEPPEVFFSPLTDEAEHLRLGLLMGTYPPLPRPYPQRYNDFLPTRPNPNI